MTVGKLCAARCLCAHWRSSGVFASNAHTRVARGSVLARDLASWRNAGRVAAHHSQSGISTRRRTSAARALARSSRASAETSAAAGFLSRALEPSPRRGSIASTSSRVRGVTSPRRMWEYGGPHDLGSTGEGRRTRRRRRRRRSGRGGGGELRGVGGGGALGGGDGALARELDDVAVRARHGDAHALALVDDVPGGVSEPVREAQRLHGRAVVVRDERHVLPGLDDVREVLALAAEPGGAGTERGEGPRRRAGSLRASAS